MIIEKWSNALLGKCSEYKKSIVIGERKTQVMYSNEMLERYKMYKALKS